MRVRCRNEGRDVDREETAGILPDPAVFPHSLGFQFCGNVTKTTTTTNNNNNNSTKTNDNKIQNPCDFPGDAP